MPRSSRRKRRTREDFYDSVYRKPFKNRFFNHYPYTFTQYQNPLYSSYLMFFKEGIQVKYTSKKKASRVLRFLRGLRGDKIEIAFDKRLIAYEPFEMHESLV